MSTGGTTNVSINQEDKSMTYYIETPKEIFWSYSKLDATYRHVEFLYRDRAKFKEMKSDRFRSYLKNTPKKAYEIKD